EYQGQDARVAFERLAEARASRSGGAEGCQGRLAPARPASSIAEPPSRGSLASRQEAPSSGWSAWRRTTKDTSMAIGGAIERAGRSSVLVGDWNVSPEMFRSRAGAGPAAIGGAVRIACDELIAAAIHLAIGGEELRNYPGGGREALVVVLQRPA
ncbi:unnamed protein product, partial [Prorocentrum cordatum]